MNRKHRDTFRNITLLTIGAALASLAVLWSWNTLAPLFGGPTFEFRHAVAFLIALIAVRVGLGHGVGRHRRVAEREARP